MSRTRQDRALTELEGAALASVVRDGPCTSYAVKERFRTSPSEFWSGSAGSIYPLMRRLEAWGLVAAKRGATGGRGHRLYRATPAGRRAFRRWLTDAARAAGMGFDPLRTRMMFLDRLSPAARARFRDDVAAALERIPAPQPKTVPALRALHRDWNRARRAAFEKILARLDRGE